MSSMTRRSFFEHTFWVSAAALASRAVSADESRAAPATTSPRPVSPNERIGVAIIGLHGRGLDHLDAYTYDDRVNLVALCDVDERTFVGAQKKLRERGRPPAGQYSDIRKLVEARDVDVVSIATPNHWHALAAIWAMQAGKDAYVEKPVSHNVSEGRRLEEARVKHKRICQAGTQSRSDAAYRQAIEYIHQGHIGNVTLARGLCYRRRKGIGRLPDGPTPPGVDYDLWLGPAPIKPFNANRFHYNWHWNWDYGNGDIGNQGVHQMDVARWALKETLPRSVMSLGGRFSFDDDGQTPNTQVALLNFEKARILFEVRNLETPPVRELSVGTIAYGSAGFVAMSNEDTGSAVAFDPDGRPVKRFKGAGNHFHNFITAVQSRNQADLACPILEGHYSSALCHLANTSFRLGEPRPFSVPGAFLGDDLDLREAFGRFEQHLADNAQRLSELSYQCGPRLAFDGQAERFVASPQANEMLTRQYRAPFVVPSTIG